MNSQQVARLRGYTNKEHQKNMITTVRSYKSSVLFDPITK
jgi:hypothetical protein